MPRHSKNNNNRAMFTYAEYQKTDYGTQKLRLGTDSLRPFNACGICLQKAIGPVCCVKGHLFCKECIYNFCLEQKRNILREEERSKNELSKKHEQLLQKQKEDELRKIETFIDIQKGVSSSRNNETDRELENSRNLVGSDFEFKQNCEIVDNENSQQESKKKIISCPITPHGISVKKLFTVNFALAQETGDKSISTQKEPICPACRKTLTNSVKLFLPRNCGHVFCKLCTEKFILTDNSCFVCGTKCSVSEIIQLRHEGTGFSGYGGKIMAETYTVAFQG